jgi:hypothetical protein
MTEITLPVSLGEALDKLTILDIKLQKISDAARRQDVQKEYDVLLQNLKPYVDAYSYHYRILKEVNLSIWEIQDVFHVENAKIENGSEMYRKILLENDRRFRVKAKINALANSALREQKGYAKKRAFVYTHLLSFLLLYTIWTCSPVDLYFTTLRLLPRLPPSAL